MFKIILWDIDGTLLDFLLAEKNSLYSAFRKLHLGACNDELVKLYSAINIKHWKMLETGEMDKPAIFLNRFAEFIDRAGIGGVSPEQLNETYENGICDTVAFMENGYDIVKSLRGQYRQYAVTNGSSSVQRRRLEKSGLNSLLDGAFISDEIGYEKPDRRFFDAVFAGTVPCRKDEILLIGDSLTSDMRGANNAGIRCCWYNPHREINRDGVRIDNEIHSLGEIYTVLSENEG